MCSDDQHREKMDKLDGIAKLLTHRDPYDQDIQISDAQKWPLDYKGYRHVFMWCPTALTLNLGLYGTGPVQAQVWVNLGLKPNTEIFTSGQTAPVTVRLRFTDEVIP